MNCDDVFAILTRGPFPSGSRSDNAVEAHLQSCPDCQQLAAALRPNDEMLQESVSSEESRALPGYWGNSLSAFKDSAISLTDLADYQERRRAGARLQRHSASKKNLTIWQFAAAVALGIVLDAALRTLVMVNHSATVFAAHNASDRGPRLQIHLVDDVHQGAQKPEPIFTFKLDSPPEEPRFSFENSPQDESIDLLNGQGQGDFDRVVSPQSTRTGD